MILSEVEDGRSFTSGKINNNDREGLMKKHVSTIFLIGMFLVGLSVLLYPLFSDFWNRKVQTKIITDYKQQVEEMKHKDHDLIFAQADNYNQKLKKLSCPFLEYKEVPGYEQTLDIDGTGVMGYVSIEKIKVELPIYHGTSPEVLNRGVGHLQGSSLPTGGTSTHTVLSAHRGLPSAKLFTDLDQLEVGDCFTLTILDRMLTYKINQILIVEPDDVEALYVEEGKEYCTLITCTPYGINTHRLLVRGERIENATNVSKTSIANEILPMDPVLVTSVVVLPIFLIFIMILLIKFRENKK